MATRSEIVDAARDLLGTPWRHQARRLPDGSCPAIDCAGLVEDVGTRSGASSYIGPTDYRREADGLRFLMHFRRAGCREISPAVALDGDILIFRVPQAVYVRHCGIRTTWRGQPHFVHALGTPGFRRVVETPLAAFWRRALVTAFLYPNVEDE